VPAPVNLIGKNFGRWLVIKRVNNISGRSAWLCKCECGVERILKNSDLRDGRTKSCGCLRKEKTSERFKTHGFRNHRLYRIWVSMKSRCYNLKVQHYSRYGGRGIQICDEWLHDFKAFYDWRQVTDIVMI
jgi:hypothetical protein